MKRFLSSLLAAGVLTALAVPVFAATLQTGEKLKIASPIKDNAYVAGAEISIGQQVSGDLLAAGADVTINAPVKADLLAAGGNVYVESAVGGDLRAVGGKIRIRSTVGGEMAIGGGSIDVRSESIIRGDVLVGGGDVTLAGTMNGDVLARGGNITLSGIVKGNVDIRAEEIIIDGSIDGSAVLVARKITFTPTAKVMKNVRFWQPKNQPDLPAAQVKGEIEYDPTLFVASTDLAKPQAAAAVGAAMVGISGYFLFSAALTILLLLLCAKTFFVDSAKYLRRNPWKSLLYGFLFFAATPIAALLFLITIIGIPVSALIMFAYIFSIIFAKPLTAVILTHWWELRREKQWGIVLRFLVSLLLYVVLKIVALIPIFGWILALLAVFAAFGALVVTKWAKWAKIR